MNGKQWLNERFDKSTLMALISGFSASGQAEPPATVLHIATHFTPNPVDLMKSTLLLGTGLPFTLQEIDMNKDLSSYDLVTLSACETALGGKGSPKKAGSPISEPDRRVVMTVPGEEVEGFAVFMQQRRAKSVLASLWKVDDVGTAQWMEAFYRFRGEQRKLTKAKAVAEVQKSMLTGKIVDSAIRDGKKGVDLKLPYYWAPFILLGNWL